MDYGPFSPDTSYTLLVRARVRVRIVESSVFLPCFPWHACSSVHDGRRELFFTCPRTARSGYVYWSVYGSWNRLCFCHVFHDTRTAPSTTGVGDFFSRVPVRPVLGTCTGPCTDRGIVYAFALFSMARVQLRPRRVSGTFLPCPPTAHSGYLYWSVYVPSTSFCPVLHVARAAPLQTAVGHFFPVSTYSPFTGSV